jgi:hypothetical protein
MEANWPAYAERVTAALFAPRLPRDTPLYRDAAAAIAANDGITMASLWRALVAADHRATLLALDIPVLALAGGESQLYGPRRRRLDRRQRGARHQHDHRRRRPRAAARAAAGVQRRDSRGSCESLEGDTPARPATGDFTMRR